VAVQLDPADLALVGPAAAGPDSVAEGAAQVAEAKLKVLLVAAAANQPAGANRSGLRGKNSSRPTPQSWVACDCPKVMAQR